MIRAAVILFALCFACAAQWYAPAYPVTNVPQFATTNRPLMTLAVQTGRFYALQTRWAVTNANWTATNGYMQARDVWQFDGYQSVWERVLPASRNPSAIATFDNETLPQDNWLALRRLRAWEKSNVTNFIITTNGPNFSAWFAAHTNALDSNGYLFPPSWDKTNICQFIGAPSNLLGSGYVPFAPFMHLGAVITATNVVCGGTNASQIVTNKIVDPWGVRDEPPVQTNSIAGTNGQRVVTVWSNGPVEVERTSDDYGWKYQLAILKNLIYTATPAISFCPLTNEIGAGGRIWELCDPMFPSETCVPAGHGTLDGCDSTSCANAETNWHFALECDEAYWPMQYRSNAPNISVN